MVTGSKLRRGLLATALIIAALLILLTAAAAWLLSTESGLRFAFARASGYLPDSVQIGAIDGTAAGPLIVRDIRVEMEAFTLELERIELEWQLRALLGREIAIDRLHADGVRYMGHETQPEPEESKEPFALPEQIELPVSVRLNDARVRDVTLRATDSSEPVAIDLVQVEAQWTDEALAVSRLEVDSPLAELEAAARVAPRGEYPLEAELEFTLRPPDYAPLMGRTRLGGSLRHLELSQTLAEPYNLDAEATVEDVLEDLRFVARVVVEQAELARIGADLPAAVASTRIAARGGVSAIEVDLTAHGVAPDVGALSAELSGEFAPGLIAIERLVVDLADETAHLEANGRIALSGPRPVVDIDAEWTGLQWPLRGPPRVASKNGSFEVTGSPVDYQALLEAELSVPNQTDGHLRVAGHGDTSSFAFAEIELATLEGTLAGTANVDWSPVPGGRVNLRGSGLDPGGLVPGWPGSIDLVIQAKGSLPDSGPVARIESLRAEGRLRGQPLELTARGSFANDLLELDTFRFRSGSTGIDVDGRIGKQLAVNWSITSDDLSSLLPAAGGEIRGQGRASGPLKEPLVTADLTASELRYEDYTLGALELEADIDVRGAAESTLDLAISEATLGGVEIASLSLDGTGTRADHALSLDAQTNVGRIELGVDGSLESDLAWVFLIERLDYAHPDLTPWSLRAPANGRLSADSAKLERLCLTGGQALLCLEGERTAEQIAAAFELEDLPLALANPLLPPTTRVDGSIGGSGNLRMRSGEGDEATDPTIDIDLNTTPIRLLAEDTGQEMQTVLAFDRGEITLKMSGPDGVALVLDLPLESEGGIVAVATVAAGTDALSSRPLKGRLRALIPELGFVTEFVPQVASLSGRIEGDVEVAGTLAAPSLRGGLALLDGNAMLSGPEVRVRDVYASVRGQGDGNLDIEARMSSGGGTLTVDGSAGRDENGLTGRLEIEGENFRAYNTPEAMVRMTPDLDVTLLDHRLEVKGVVRVPTAEITLVEAPASAVGVSRDQVIVEPGAEEAGGDEALEVAARVRVILGDEVNFTGFGLAAKLGGDLTVIETPGEPTTATGDIRIEEGLYAAYGQELEIDRGQVFFAGGPIDQPGIDVRAVRRPAEDILVGVEVRGTLRQPQFEVFSEPPMSDSEQLAYLVLGRPLEGGPASENSALARAALALGIKGGNYLTEQFGDKLGVDEIGIETEPGQNNEQAALVLGKYLSPKLYVSYGVGLLEPISTLRLRYTLSSKWRLVTESSSIQSGGDLFYSIER
ncbi:translocation/assembly module TamB domain-containing protein [soil metagenome]